MADNGKTFTGRPQQYGSSRPNTTLPQRSELKWVDGASLTGKDRTTHCVEWRKDTAFKSYTRNRSDNST